MKNTEKRMKELREELNDLIVNSDKYSEENVLKISRELDRVINGYIKEKSTW